MDSADCDGLGQIGTDWGGLGRIGTDQGQQKGGSQQANVCQWASDILRVYS